MCKLVLAVSGALFLCGCAGDVVHSSMSERLNAPTRQEYNAAALAGDLSDIQRRLTDLSDDSDGGLAQQFDTRFIKRTDPPSAIEDEAVLHIVERYMDYWRDALLAPADLASLEDKLALDIAKIAGEFGWRIDPDDMTEGLKGFIESRGLLAITGRTPPLLELIIWSENARIPTMVTLTDGEYEIPVTYLRGFLVRGWSYFATFGAASTGGWTTDEGLFCVEDSYDLNSEKFNVSFLKHEARHYVDNIRFPNLPPVELEYRAKLTELYFAEETLSHLLGVFQRNAARVESAPHSMANWRVIHDLSTRLLHKDWAGEAIASLPPEKVRAAAISLLDRDTARLEALRAD